uniref:PNPLA domain-containing protein n=1 Tax=Globodera rostochiensis TaxID=31243 RepID=A0A914ICP8_GLORO
MFRTLPIYLSKEAQIIYDGLTKQQKKSFVERNFDWIAGTSTGAIVALALADKTAHLECLRLYLSLKDEIFGAEAKARLGGYKAENLDLFLQEHFGKFRTMDQLKSSVNHKILDRGPNILSKLRRTHGWRHREGAKRSVLFCLLEPESRRNKN